MEMHFFFAKKIKWEGVWGKSDEALKRIVCMLVKSGFFLLDKSLSFISRTGKTSDMTKLKGWKNKLVRRTEASSLSCDGIVTFFIFLIWLSGIKVVILIKGQTKLNVLPSLSYADGPHSHSVAGTAKNLSAFCSNMLDEYLESEGQMICERAAAFSTRPEDPVVYQLPAKSSSYVRTLDSVLKQRNSAPKDRAAASKPCPLSYKVPQSSAAAQFSPTAQGGVQTGQCSATYCPVKTGSVLQG